VSAESYQIPVPYRDRDQPLVDARADLRAAPLSPAERDVAREVLSAAVLEDGLETVGELLDRLEDPGERFATLNRARAELGLDDVETARSREHLERINRAMTPGRDRDGRSIQQCPECGAVSSGPSGIPEPAAAARWHCPAHEHLARPGDLEPPEDLEPRIDMRTMTPASTRAELERIQREDERRAEEQAERNEQRKAEAEAIAKARERFERETPGPDVMGWPMSRIRVDK
jgi:hypothetical protein